MIHKEIDFTNYTDGQLREYVLSQFPGVMNQLDASNNQKWLEMVSILFIGGIRDLRTIYENMNPAVATGKDLDLLGADWGVSRIDSDDDFLRFLIALAKLKRLLGTSEDDLIRLISATLGADPSEFTVETRLDVVGEVEAIKILNIPNKYNNSPRKTKLLSQYLQDCVADEVRIAEIQFATYSRANVYVGALTQKLRKTHAPLLLSREINTKHHIYVGVANQRWHQTFSHLINKPS